jgi:hypothetical protein
VVDRVFAFLNLLNRSNSEKDSEHNRPLFYDIADCIFFYHNKTDGCVGISGRIQWNT